MYHTQHLRSFVLSVYIIPVANLGREGESCVNYDLNEPNLRSMYTMGTECP